MYTLSRAPSKLASKTPRRGPVQQISSFENRETGQKRELGFVGGTADMSSPKAVFNGKKVYNRSNSNPPSPYTTNSGDQSSGGMAQDPVTPQHEENVRFVSEGWYHVCREQDGNQRRHRDDGPECYSDKAPKELQGFVPLDLDDWLATRMMEKIKC